MASVQSIIYVCSFKKSKVDLHFLSCVNSFCVSVNKLVTHFRQHTSGRNKWLHPCVVWSTCEFSWGYLQGPWSSYERLHRRRKVSVLATAYISWEWGGLGRHFQVLPGRRLMSQLCARKMVLRPVMRKKGNEQDGIWGGCAGRWEMCAHLYMGERGQKSDQEIEAKWKHDFRRLEGMGQSTDKRFLLMKKRTRVPYTWPIVVCYQYAEVCAGQKVSRNPLWFTMWLKRLLLKRFVCIWYTCLPACQGSPNPWRTTDVSFDAHDP